MKTIEISKGYKVLENVKLSGLSPESQFNIIKALRFLKPIHDSYESDIKDIDSKVTSFSAEEIEKNREIAMKHMQAVNSKSVDNLLSTKEVSEMNEFFSKLDKETSEIKQRIENEDIDLTFTKLSEDDYKKLLTANESISAGDKMILYDIIC